MATLSKAESRRLYSWWWNSHISPKNSKWLEENLADIDKKVKAMIKLLEEDADSFARRAEMYYKKRPELLKLVEEFYRAYRALAEKYDHALRQAHRTMTEAFPNQIPPVLPDDSGFSAIDQDPQETTPPMDSLDKEAALPRFRSIERNETHWEENDPVSSKNTSKKFNSGRIRKGLNFEGERPSQLKVFENPVLWEKGDIGEEIRRLEEEISQLSKENGDLDNAIISQSLRADNAESEVQKLQDSVSRFISEKDVALIQYQLSLEKISSLEVEISRTQEEVKTLSGEKLAEHKKLNDAAERYVNLEKAKESLELALKASETKQFELMEQLVTFGQDMKSSGMLIDELKAGNFQLQDVCEKHQHEKVVLREQIDKMGKISEEKLALESSVLNANSEIENLREKIKTLEESLEFLKRQISNHISENSALVSQVDSINENMEKLKEDNAALEISSTDANAEIESLRGKLKVFEESCQSLSDQNSTLAFENNALLCQVQGISQSLQGLEIRHSELQENNMKLEREKDLVQRRVIELEEELKVEKQGHEDLVQSSKEQKTILESQINILQEGCRMREELVGLEQQKIMKSQIDIFLLQGCLQDVEEVSAALAVEHHAVLAKSKGMEETISVLRQECHNQDMVLSSLVEKNENMREGIGHVLRDLNPSSYVDQGADADGEFLIQRVRQEARGILRSLSSREDENRHLAVENTINSTLLKQFGLNIVHLKLEKDALEGKLGIKNAELSAMKGKANELLEMNELLNQEVRVINEREEVLSAEMEAVCRRLSDLQASHHVLHNSNSNLLEDYDSLLKKFADACDIKRELDVENSSLLSEALKLDLLYVIFESFNSERASELTSHADNIRFLTIIRDGFEKEIGLLHEKLHVLEDDNSSLMETIAALDAFRRRVQVLEEDLGVANGIISKFSEDGVHKDNEIASLIHAKESLNQELGKLSKTIRELESREILLASKLQECTGEIDCCELEIGRLLEELQLTSINAALFEEKLLVTHEGATKDSSLGDAYLGDLNEQAIGLERKSGGSMAKSFYLARIVSLHDGIASLEKSVLSLAKQNKTYNKKKQLSEEDRESERGNLVLQVLQHQVGDLLGLVKEIGDNLEQQGLDTHGNSESADIMKLDGRVPSFRRRMWQNEVESSEVKHRQAMKDIELDRASCSSPTRRRELVSASAPVAAPGNGEIKSLDRPEAEEKGSHTDKRRSSSEDWRSRVLGRLNFDAQRLALLQASAEELRTKMEALGDNNSPPSFELNAVVAQLKEAEEAILRQSWMNNEMKEKAEWLSESFDGRGDDASEEKEARRKRSNKRTESETFFLSGSFDSSLAGEEKHASGRTARKRKILVHVRKGSERIGKLELEMEKINYMLLKLGEKQEYYGDAKAGRKKRGRRRVSLSDYLYGRSRSIRRTKKMVAPALCACIRTTNDSD